MKKRCVRVGAVLMAVLMALSLCACGEGEATATPTAATLDAALARVNPVAPSTVWVADGHAAELRAMASSAVPADRYGRSGADLEVTAPLGELAALVAAQGPDAVALGPEQLRDRVRGVLSAAVEAAR